MSNWAQLDLGPVLGDDYVSLAEHDGDVWIAHLVDDRTAIEVRNLAGDSAHRFDAAQSMGPPQLRSTPFGMLLISSDYETFRPLSRLTSDGGATWIDGTISELPFDVSGVAVVDGNLLAPGAFRPIDQPSMGPFTPGMFRSDDGVTWSEVELDRTVFDSTDGGVGPIIDAGDRLVTTSSREDGGYFVPALFESHDGGLTWQTVSDPSPAPTMITNAGPTLFGIDSFHLPDAPADPITVYSSGAWTAIDVSGFVPPFQNSSSFVLAGGVAALITFAVEPTVDYCYEHPDDCEHGYLPTLLLIDQDESVVSVDLGFAAARAPSSALVRSDGSLDVVTYDGDRLVLRSWDASNGPVPTLPDVAPFVSTGPPVVQWDSDLELGTTYRFPLGTHCGIDFLGNFNGRHWWIVGAPTDAYDASQLVYTQRVLGEVTMIDEATIEYRLDGALVATYAPSPEEPPPCA